MDVMTRTAAPGLWLVVVDRGEVVISDALGLASVVGPTPLTRETVVRLVGANQLAINLAVLRLAERGLLDPDAPIGGYVAVPAALRRVTARQLITQPAGLRAYHFSSPLWEDGDLAREVQSWDERIFIADPGETRSQSHYGIALAGHVVESVVGKPFPEAMRVEPLGLDFIGWPNAAFLSLDGMERFAVALAQPSSAGVTNGGKPRPEWKGSGNWAGVHFRVIVDGERGFSALVADNGGSAAAELATAIERIALARPAPPEPAPIAWRVPTPEAQALLPGVYENEFTFEIVLRDGKLVALSTGAAAEIRQGPDNQFAAVGDRAPTLFTIESTRNGKVRHLRIGSRVWLRTGP